MFPGKEKATETLQNYGIITGKEMLTQRHHNSAKNVPVIRLNDEKNAFFFILAVRELTGVCAYIDATVLNSAFVYFLGLD